MLQVFVLRVRAQPHTHKARVSCPWLDRYMQEVLAPEPKRKASNTKVAPARRWVPCRAKTRKDPPCRIESEPAHRCCKFRVGKSTGANAPEGRARMTESHRTSCSRRRMDEQPPNGTSLASICGPAADHRVSGCHQKGRIECSGK